MAAAQKRHDGLVTLREPQDLRRCRRTPSRGPRCTCSTSGLPGYAATPLRDMPAWRAAAGVGRVLVKDESSRARSAGVQGPRRAVGHVPAAGERMGGAAVDDAGRPGRHRGRAGRALRLVTATDGNHGRPWPGWPTCSAWAPPSSCSRAPPTPAVDGSEGEAEVIVQPGTYEDAVTTAPAWPATARWWCPTPRGPATRTSPPGHRGLHRRSSPRSRPRAGGGSRRSTPPSSPWRGPGRRRPNQPAGQPSRATARCWSGSSRTPPPASPPPWRPGTWSRSRGRTGRSWPGSTAGSPRCWRCPTVTATFDAFVAIDDDRARQAIRALAGAGLDVGETGAAAGRAAGRGRRAPRARPLPAEATVSAPWSPRASPIPPTSRGSSGRPPRASGRAASRSATGTGPAGGGGRSRTPSSCTTPCRPGRRRPAPPRRPPRRKRPRSSPTGG